MENQHLKWENPLYMVISHSYVELPDEIPNALCLFKMKCLMEETTGLDTTDAAGLEVVQNHPNAETETPLFCKKCRLSNSVRDLNPLESVFKSVLMIFLQAIV